MMEAKTINKGIYCLVIRIAEDCRIRVGRHQGAAFRPGFYCYVGSALNNLEKRIRRHRSSVKRKHWHIDYLLEYGRITDIKRIETTQRLECNISRAVGRMADEVMMKGFGSSDCSCQTHLHYFRKNPGRVLDRCIKEGLNDQTL